MRRAINLAKQAAKAGEVPIGAVLVSPLKKMDSEALDERTLTEGILSEAGNLRESEKSPTAHAEILAIEKAAKKSPSWRLSGATLYVTLEPCLMCAGAILNSRIYRLVYGAQDPKGGAVDSLYSCLSDSRLNHQCQVTQGVLADECGEILRQFFKELRLKK